MVIQLQKVPKHRYNFAQQGFTHIVFLNLLDRLMCWMYMFTDLLLLLFFLNFSPHMSSSYTFVFTFYSDWRVYVGPIDDVEVRGG